MHCLIDAIDFSPSGELVALGSEQSRYAHVVDLTKKVVIELKGTGAVGARFLANWTEVIAGDDSGRICTWSLTTRKSKTVHKHAGDGIWSLASGV